MMNKNRFFRITMRANIAVGIFFAILTVLAGLMKLFSFLPQPYGIFAFFVVLFFASAWVFFWCLED